MTIMLHIHVLLFAATVSCLAFRLQAGEFSLLPGERQAGLIGDAFDISGDGSTAVGMIATDRVVLETFEAAWWSEQTTIFTPNERDNGRIAVFTRRT